MAPGEPSTVEHALGGSRFSHRPLLRADTFALNANRRGFKTKSKGQEEHTGLAILAGKGPVSRARRRGRSVCASVQTRNRTKRQTVMSGQAHNIPTRPANKDCGDATGPGPNEESPSAAQCETAVRHRAQPGTTQGKKTSKETVFEMRRGRKRRKDTFGVAL